MTDIQKMGITALKREKKRLKDVLEEVLDGPKREPNIVAALDEYRRLLGEAVRMARAVAGPIRKRREDVEVRIRELEDSKKLAVPERIRKIVAQLFRGCNYGVYELPVVWISPEERFFILKNPGSTGWSGIGETAYSPASHYLMDASLAPKDFEAMHGHDLFSKIQVFEHDGRLLKAKKEEWMVYALKEEGQR